MSIHVEKKILILKGIHRKLRKELSLGNFTENNYLKIIWK